VSAISDNHSPSSSPSERDIDRLLRPLAPQVLGALVRRHGRFDLCEDAVQEALLAAALQWPREGIPGNPRGWLIAVATRRLIDDLRAEQARRRREEADAAAAPAPAAAPAASGEAPAPYDDTLTLLFLCCHPALTAASQIALTLRAIGGLTTAQIASAFLVPEATMAQRISRAKQTIKASGVGFEMPPEAGREQRLAVVLHVLYLIFNEGYTASSGPEVQRTALAGEAIRITRMLHRLLPADGEVTGLLSLMLLTHARRRARSGPDGALIPLAEQDRGLWDRGAIEEGVGLIEHALVNARLGQYQLQAAIAAVHAEAADAEETDWRQISALYELLERVTSNPMITLNRAVAVAMVNGPQAGLELLAEVEHDGRLEASHRVDAVRAHLLELAGDRDGAVAAYERAARRTTSIAERRYLESRAAGVRSGSADT
jgi:RNA polymerase sigma factor (sigma-70 family)